MMHLMTEQELQNIMRRHMIFLLVGAIAFLVLFLLWLANQGDLKWYRREVKALEEENESLKKKATTLLSENESLKGKIASLERDPRCQEALRTYGFDTTGGE